MRLVFASLALVVVGCTEPTPDPLTHVMTELRVPQTAAEAQTLGFDLDGDATIDNAFGQGLAAWSSSTGADLNSFMDSAIFDGDVITLLSIIDDDADFFRGSNPNPAPPDHLSGNAEFTVGAALGSAPGTVSVDLVLAEGQSPFALQLTSSRFSYDGEMLGGVVTEADAVELMTDFIQASVAADCMGAFPNCCDVGSTGENYLATIDAADDDCAVTAQQVQDSTTIQGLTTADLPEGISLGIHLSTIDAIF